MRYESIRPRYFVPNKQTVAGHILVGRQETIALV